MRLKANKTGNGELKLMKNYHPPRALVNSFFLRGRSRALSGFNLNSKLELRALYNYCFFFVSGGGRCLIRRLIIQPLCVFNAMCLYELVIPRNMKCPFQMLYLFTTAFNDE